MINSLKNASSDELYSELSFLIIDKKKLLRQIDDIDTQIIGIKEEIRSRKENAGNNSSILNQDIDDISF